MFIMEKENELWPPTSNHTWNVASHVTQTFVKADSIKLLGKNTKKYIHDSR